jgi:hypothetical protein
VGKITQGFSNLSFSIRLMKFHYNSVNATGFRVSFFLCLVVVNGRQIFAHL